MMTIEQRCKTDLIELHHFFQAWFAGRLPPTDESFARLANVLSDQFVIIGCRVRSVSPPLSNMVNKSIY
ncbi:MAG: hypothetical protein ACPGWR_13635 [Ardenticatenaceae bacterium]